MVIKGKVTTLYGNYTVPNGTVEVVVLVLVVVVVLVLATASVVKPEGVPENTTLVPLVLVDSTDLEPLK